MTDKPVDIIVAGGGSAGWAAALSASRNGAEVLLIEQLGYLGGAPTSTYITPMMKTMLKDGTNLGSKIYLEILERMKKKGFAATNFDGNPGWFAPEMMKCELDELLEESGVNILLHTRIFDVITEGKKIIALKVLNNAGIEEYSAKFFIDATAEAFIATRAGVPFEIGREGKTQAMSHRFIMAGVDIDKFSAWLEKIDPDTDVSPVYHTEAGDILLTTAYTSEDKGWKLKPLFLDAIKKGIIESCDSEYFQIFTAPGQKGSVFFNCPRIYSDKPLSPISPEDITYAQIMGRKQILRLAEFSKYYLPGFENAYISNIAPEIGIRDSRRILGKYILTSEDVLSGRKFENPVAKSNYPVDIHSSKPGEGGLKFLKEGDYYEIPLESLQTNEIDNILVAGKCISAEFAAQASLRVQPTCITMGESAGYYAVKFLKES